MQLQLQARSPTGFDARLLGRVRRIPGVAEALPVLEEQAEVIGPRGRESVELLGSDPRFAHAGGPLLRHFSTEQLAHQQALALPAPVAKAIGAESLLPIEIQVGTHVTTTLLGATLQEGDIGALVDSPVAIAPVGYAEPLSGNVGRVTRIFVRAEPGREAQVRAALARLAAGRLNVEPADFDSTLFAQGGRADEPGRGTVLGDQRAGRLPVRFQRDADHRAAATQSDRRTAPPRRDALDDDHHAAVRRAGPGRRSVARSG